MAKVNLSLDRKSLASAMKLLAFVAPKKTNVPILTNSRLTVNGTAEFVATDLDLGIAVELERDGKGDGTALVPIGRFAQYIGVSKGSRVELAFDAAFKDGTPASIELDRRMKLTTDDPDQFPAVLDAPKATLRIDAAEMARGLKAARLAVSSEVVRYALTGVLIEVTVGKRIGIYGGSGTANMVSSDGKRLIVVPIKVEAGSKPCRAIMPIRAANLLAKLAADAAPGAVAEFSFEKKSSDVGADDPGTLHVRIGSARIWSRLLDGNFPDWQAVCPTDRDRTYRLDRKALLAAVEEVSIVTDDRTRAVRFTLAGGACELFARCADVGEARVSVPLIGVREPEAFVICLNPDFVLDYLADGAGKAETVILMTRDPKSAAVWSTGAREPKYVIMPLTVDL